MACLAYGLAIALPSGAHSADAGPQLHQTPVKTWSIWFDNDQFALVPARKERWYTQGMGLRQVSVWQDDVWRVLSISHQMFTPASTRTADPQPLDRPYAAALYAGMQVFHADAEGRAELGIDLGVLGPSAGAQALQRSVHRLLRQPLPLGWRYQLQDQPWLQVKAAQVWRLARNPGGADLLARAGIELGHPRNALQAGVAARWGAVPETVSWPGSAVPMTQASRGLMFQAHAQLQAVASDALLDGQPQDSESQVTRRRIVPEAGLGLSWALRPTLGVDASLLWRARDFDSPSGLLPAAQRWAGFQMRGSFD